MKLAHRLLVFALGVIVLLIAGILGVVDGRLRARITDDRVAELHREANLVAGQRMSGVAAIDLAESASVALGGRVTLVDSAGVIVGDAYRGRSSSRIGQPSAPPHQIGRSLGRDAGFTVPRDTEGAGGAVPELYVSVRNARGVTRVAVEAATIDRIFDSARWEVLTAGFIAAVVAMVFSIGYAIYVSGPVIQLRDHAQALALRDYSARPEVDAPGELGDLATSLMQLSVQLESLETVRREFVANVSHELCSPLTIASGFAATLVKDDPPTAVRRQFARAILSNTTRMQRVVDDLLDLSRIEGGGWLVRAQTVRLGDAVSEVFDSLGPSAAANGTALVCDWSADAAVLHADLAAVRQILSNLTENAIRYTNRGIITIFSETTAETVCIGVRDTGVGIEPEHLSRVFERFYRADKGRAADSGGTGLGLAIVKLMTEAHGGRVEAESTVGVGTTVRAFFPRPPSRDRVMTPIAGVPMLRDPGSVAQDRRSRGMRSSG